MTPWVSPVRDNSSMTTTQQHRDPVHLTLVRQQILGADFSALVDEAGRLAAAGFVDADTLVAGTGRRLAVGTVTEDTDPQHRVRRALSAYQDGDLAAIDDLPVAPARTEFTTQVVRAMRAIVPGHPITYTELAANSGRPAAARAAANVCATNPVALVVPCHRVVRQGGAIGGYLFGSERKQALLDHERRHA